MTSNDPHLAIEAVWRIESAKLIAALTRMTQDVGLAEDFAQEALVAALQQWPASGFPPKPGAWLMAAAKYRVIDHFRRDRMLERKHLELGIEREELEARVPDFLSAMDDYIEDDLLRLIFIACHPVLTIDSRAALTLRLLCGLTTEEIARAFLTTESTIAQRIVRAKKTLSESQVPFAVPRGPEFETRLNSVLQVIYLIFNEGYTATSGPDLIRDALCEEALRLGRILATLAPEEPEVFGLVSLIEIQSSRNAARINDAGDPILLLDQDRLKWDRSLIQRGLAALKRAKELGGTSGIYRLQAEIASCHARARTAAETDWSEIADLYAKLAAVMPSPVVELNQAVAISMVFGPAAGLELIDQRQLKSALPNYHLLPSVRGNLLEKLGRHAEAALEFERAATLTDNARESELLANRAAICKQLSS